MDNSGSMPRLRCIEAGKYEVVGFPNLRIMRIDGWWEAFEGADHGFGVEWHPLAGVPKRTMRDAVATYLPNGANVRHAWKGQDDA